MSDKAAFTHVDPDGRFQFHTPDGRVVIVHGDKPHTTSDPVEIAFLDQTPSVKRAEKAKTA